MTFSNCRLLDTFRQTLFLTHLDLMHALAAATLVPTHTLTPVPPLQPKARIVARLWSPGVGGDPLQSVCSALLRMLVDDALDDVAYDASLAGLQSSVGEGDHCVDLAVSGFRYV